jgi:hypothetical protein
MQKQPETTSKLLFSLAIRQIIPNKNIAIKNIHFIILNLSLNMILSNFIFAKFNFTKTHLPYLNQPNHIQQEIQILLF